MSFSICTIVRRTVGMHTTDLVVENLFYYFFVFPISF